MMLPALPWRPCGAPSGRLLTASLFAGSYLGVWALVGVCGVCAVPAARDCRRWRDRASSGFQFGLRCTGSCIGLTAMMVALGVMSITWMAVIPVLVLAQKLLPVKPPLILHRR